MQHWITPHTPQEQDAFTAGMIAADEYRLGRDLPAKRIAPALPAIEVSGIERFDQTVKALTVPVLRLTVLAGGVCVVGSVVISGVSAVIAFVSANAMALGGSILAVVTLLGVIAGRSSGGAAKEAGSGQANAQAQNIYVNVNVAGGTVTTNQPKQ